MFAQFKKMVHDVLTENDGHSYDIVRVITAFCCVSGWPTFLGLAIYSVYTAPDHHFDMIAFGTAFGAIIASIAATAVGIGQKQKTDIRIIDTTNSNPGNGQ